MLDIYSSKAILKDSIKKREIKALRIKDNEPRPHVMAHPDYVFDKCRYI